MAHSHPLASALALALAGAAVAQTSAPPPVTLTADQDRQNMMDQLGIKALRPGYSALDAHMFGINGRIGLCWAPRASTLTEITARRRCLR